MREMEPQARAIPRLGMKFSLKGSLGRRMTLRVAAYAITQMAKSL